ncbi:tetratricopeptide repeat protein [Methanolobus bombayensis]|uniref:tetratricopeptide repeat protein n=1 Tax=Methanolobus bombayensis TaxID=38023 RepID=UPI001AE2A10C|nr:tetratricopeptide repeat protein [Methanolobus bombayensis]MBP1909186.1 Tfp pilus assembly protein PilF [Methanolobus bombayensis]
MDRSREHRENDVSLLAHWINKGNKAKNGDEAISFYDKALELDYRNPDALFAKGSALYKLGKYQDALKYLNYTTGNDRNHAEAWYLKGLVVEKMDIPFSAIKCYKETVRIEKDHIDAWNCMADVLFRVKRYKEAIKCYNTVLKCTTKDVKCHINKGRCFANIGEMRLAHDSLNKAIKIDSSNALAYHLKGKIFKLEGKNNYATKYFELRDFYSILCPNCHKRLLSNSSNCPYCSTRLFNNYTNPDLYSGYYTEFIPPAPVTIMCKVFNLPWGMYKYNKGADASLDDIRLKQIQMRLTNKTYCCETCKYFVASVACDYKQTKVNPKAICKHFEPKKNADFVKPSNEPKKHEKKAVEKDYQFISERKTN